MFSNTCINESKELYKKGKYSSSIHKIESCLDNLNSMKNRDEMSEAYFGLGSNYIGLGELDSALKYFLISEKLLKNSINQKLYSTVLNDLSVCYIRKGLNQNAIFYLKKCIEINKEIGLNERLTHNYINLGHASVYLNKLELALKYYYLALKVADIEDSRIINQIWNSIGVVYSKKEDYSNSKLYADKVLNNLSENTNRNDRLFFVTNRNLYFIAAGDTINNEDDFEEYLVDSDKLGPEEIADANFKASIYSLYKNNFKNAVTYLNKANSIYTENNNFVQAIEITKFFSIVVRNLNIKSNFNRSDLILKFRTEEAELYSNELENELIIKEEIERTIIELNKEVKFAWTSVEFLSILIFVLVLLIPITIKYIITKNVLSAFKKTVNNYNEETRLMHKTDVQNNIAKMTNLMLLSNIFTDDDMFVKTIEDLQKGSNKVSEHLSNLKLSNRRQNVNIKFTNELQLDE